MEERPFAVLGVHQPALNHVGLWDDDRQAAVDWLSQQGVRFAPGGIRAGAAGYDVCFFHLAASSARLAGSRYSSLSCGECGP